MDLGLSDEQQPARRVLRQPARQVVVARAGAGRRARRASTRRCGARSLDTGAVTMAVAEDRGGWGASLLDLALVAEQVGRALAPAPVIEAQVAARLLAAVGAPRGRSTPSAACWPASSSSPSPSARPRGGVAALVAGGRGVRRGGRARRRPPRARPRRRRRPPPGRQPGGGAARRRRPRPGGGTELAAGADGRRRGSRPRSTSGWSLTAAALVGHRRRAPSTSAAPTPPSARRSASPIGSFQGVAHPLADDATAPRRRPPARPQGGVGPRPAATPAGRELAAMAFAFASRHRRGRHLRRPPRPRRLRLHARVRRAAPLPAGPRLGPGVGRRRGRRPAGRRTPATARTGDGLMDFAWDAETEAFRARGAGLPRRAPARPSSRSASTRTGVVARRRLRPGARRARTGSRPTGRDERLRRRSAPRPCTCSRRSSPGPRRPIYAVSTVDDGGPGHPRPSAPSELKAEILPEGRRAARSPSPSA